MKDITFIIYGKFISILFVILGLAFVIMMSLDLDIMLKIPEDFKDSYTNGSDDSLYVVISTGIALVMAGVVLYMMFGKLKYNAILITPIRIIALFLFLLGLLAVFCMYMNVWSWILFFLAAIMMGISFCLKNWTNRINTKEPYND